MGNVATTNRWLCVTDVEKSTKVVNAATNTWTTVTSSPDTSALETPRAAPVCDSQPDRIEAAVVAVGNKDQPGNGLFVWQFLARFHSESGSKITLYVFLWLLGIRLCRLNSL